MGILISAREKTIIYARNAVAEDSAREKVQISARMVKIPISAREKTIISARNAVEGNSAREKVQISARGIYKVSYVDGFVAQDGLSMKRVSFVDGIVTRGGDLSGRVI